VHETFVVSQARERNETKLKHADAHLSGPALRIYVPLEVFCRGLRRLPQLNMQGGDLL